MENRKRVQLELRMDARNWLEFEEGKEKKERKKGVVRNWERMQFQLGKDSIGSKKGHG